MKNNTLSLFLTLTACFITAIINAEPIKGDEVVITVDQLRLRESPDIKSNVIKLLKKGDLAYVIEESEKTERIKGIEGKWYKVKIDLMEGWVFGGFLEKTKREQVKQTDKYTTWFNRSEGDNENNYFYMKMKDKNEVIKIKTDAETWEYEISQNGKYVAFDSGTDVIGGIEIYDIETKKMLYSATYSPRDLIWKNDSIEIHRVISTHHCYLLWELDVFENGKIKKNTKKGKGEYHCE